MLKSMAATDDRELEEIRRKKMREYLDMLSKGNKEETKIEEPLIKHLSDKELQASMDAGEDFILDLWAEWCAPCKKLEPIYEELAEEYGGKVKFYKLNVDDYPQVSMRFGVMGIPTTIFFRGGKPVDRIVGLMPKSIFMSKIHQHYL